LGVAGSVIVCHNPWLLRANDFPARGNRCLQLAVPNSK
jgi:hypothetical protein